MSCEDGWTAKLADRLHNSPAAEWILSAKCPIQVDGLPHEIGRRVTEICALAGRSAKRGADLAIFVPPPDAIDVLVTVIYLYLVRLAVLSGLSAPGRWGTVERLQQLPDIWLFGNVSRLRTTLLERIALDGSPLTQKVRCSWCARRAGKTIVESVGARKLPAIYLLSAEAVAQGALAELVNGGAAPFAIVVDSTGMDANRELAGLLGRIRQFSPLTPIVVLGQIGDKATILGMRGAKIPVWILRGGDVVRLDQCETELSPAIAPRPGGADRSGSILAAGIRVELAVLEDPEFERLICPILDAAQRLESVASADLELLGRARNLVRGVLGLSVPWKLHTEAIASVGRVGRYGVRSLEARLDALEGSATTTGEASSALLRLVQSVQLGYDVLRRPHCVTPKQAALLHMATRSQDSGRSLCVVCENEVTKRAVQIFLTGCDIDVVHGPVQIMTRSEIRRAAWMGTGAHAVELLLLEPLGFGAGFYFSGVAPIIHILIHKFERDAVGRQLGFIAHDTQCASASHGDKRDWVVGLDRITTDSSTDAAAALWCVQYSLAEAKGVFPGNLPAVGAFVLPDSGWLQRALDDGGEEQVTDDDGWAPSSTNNQIGPRVLIELDDNEEPAALAVDTPLLLLDELQRTGEGTILASDARPGMVVLIPRRMVGAALLDRLLEQFEVSSDYVIAAQFQRMWKDAIALLADRTGSSASIAYSWLARHGVCVTTPQAVHYWMRGLVMGPRSAESIRALGHATERSELILHYRKVHAAIGEVRRWRRALATKLAEYVRSGSALGPDGIIDSQLGLRRTELEDMTRIGRVTKITRLVEQGG